MQESNPFKAITWVLVVIVIILLAVMWSRSKETVNDTFDSITVSLTECRDELGAWETANPSGVAATPDEQAKLDEIMERCAGVLQNAQDSIGSPQEATTTQ